MLCLAKWEQRSFNIYLDHFKAVCDFLDTPKLILNSWGSIVWECTLKAFCMLLCMLWGWGGGCDGRCPEERAFKPFISMQGVIFTN